MSALRRIGHKGADLIVPGNTPASFDAALAAGVDMIEFDVLPERRDDPDSRLVLAHDCKGKPAHDARLVAAMNVHKVDQLLTFNHQDFGRFAGIKVLVPGAISQAK